MASFQLQIQARLLVWAGILAQLIFVVVHIPLAAAEIQPLAGTKPLRWKEYDLSVRLMDGAHRFVERKIDEAQQRRAEHWSPDPFDGQPTEATRNKKQDLLRELIGAVDTRVAPRLQAFADLPDSPIVATTPTWRVRQVRWPVLEGVEGEGLLVGPAAPLASVILIPDADQTPEQLLGLAPGIAEESQIARRLATAGIEVLIPTLVSRQKLESDPRLIRSDQTHREWLYRQAFHMGRHPLGYEVQKVLAAVDWFATRRAENVAPIGVAGYGEGALIAFYAAAVDTRIDAALVSGYFDSRQHIWSEPIDRNIWNLLESFGDAEIAVLIQPRGLVLEYSPTPAVTGHKGDISTPPFDRVAAEVKRLQRLGRKPPATFVHGEAGQTVAPYSVNATAAFLKKLGIRIGQAKQAVALGELPSADARRTFSASARQQRTVAQIERHVQQLVRASAHVRDQGFLYRAMPELNAHRWSTKKELPTLSADKFTDACKPFREQFHHEAMGSFDEPLLPANPRTRKILETVEWTAWDVVLDVYPELFAWGVLIVPKNLQPGEKRPVVVCQHGRQAIPRDTIDQNDDAYNNFAAKLAERGFITFAPHNLYRGEDRYRWLDRKANSIGCTLFSFIISQHDQITRWLDSLEMVDGNRIAFYGLSYGGETAVRVPTVLQKYCLSICSGDFNQWTRKVAATDQPFSFMRTIEWEMPYWNLGHTFDYAEMTYLMIPRPFMVERGHLDRVAHDQWVAHEYAKVRWLYAQLGLAERTEIEFFQGGHSINGQRTFAFLHKHLDWPKPR